MPRVATPALRQFLHSSCDTTSGTVTSIVIDSRQHHVVVGAMRVPHTLSSTLHLMKSMGLWCRKPCKPTQTSDHLALQRTQRRPHLSSQVYALMPSGSALCSWQGNRQLRFVAPGLT